MKTNKEPKVLYLQPDSSHPAGKRYLNLNKVSDNDIEYTRTDVFVEKSCFYIKNMILDMTYLDTDGNEKYDINEFIEDYKKYMKGE